MFNTEGLIEQVKKHGRWETIFFTDENGEMKARQCARCKEIKSANDFGQKEAGFMKRSSICFCCSRKQDKEWKSSNKEKMKERSKEYYEKNKEKVAIRFKKYYNENKEHLRELGLNNYWKNREKRIEQHREWCANNLEHRRKYRRDNIEKYRNHNRRYVAKKNKLPNDLTNEGFKQLLEIQSSKCILTLNDKNLHLEHFLPVSIGYGGTTFGNCYYMDGLLNQSKGNRNPFEWVETQSEDIQKRFYCLLVPMMAKRNNMSVKEFENYVNHCFENPRTLEELSIDAV